jgi:hypothetical protein
MVIQININNVKFVIPSFGRYDSIKLKTLNLLEKYNINKRQIYIFVVKDELELYKMHNPEYNNIIIGELGLHNQRNFINRYFKNNCKIVSLDDDLEDFKMLNIENILMSVPDMKAFITMVFREMLDKNAFISGVSQTDNDYFMKNSITYDLSFLIGHFFCYINRHNNDLIINNQHKEDYERTIKYFLKDKIIVKYNGYCFKTKTYLNSSGMNININNRILQSNQRVEELINMYPDIIYKKNSKSKFNEIKLKQLKSIFQPVKQVEAFNNDDPDIISLFNELEKTKFKVNNKRISVGSGYTQTFGKQRIRRLAGLFDCKNNNKYQQLYQQLLYFGERYIPLSFTSIQVNKNYKSNPHIDYVNKRESCIIGIGNYKGGKTTINGIKYDIKNKITIFNACKYIHSNELSSNNENRYSICYFTL